MVAERFARRARKFERQRAERRRRGALWLKEFSIFFEILAIWANFEQNIE